MPYIIREDGQHFVIPSYRDVLTAKSKSALKKDILLLSQNYGEYITLQRKNTTQYEVAFSPDTGYLLGESIWQYFKKPLDMIYCEVLPNTSEAILVIVKAGSVYLDGSFPLESIPEELIIFLTQQNHFEVYIYGNVPISETPQEGKFAFETSSIRSFTVLDKPVFPMLPLIKIYQLQLVDQVLKSQGIGVFPLRQVVIATAVIIFFILAYHYLKEEKEIVKVMIPITEVNPFQAYNEALVSPSPDDELKQFVQRVEKLFTMPGWVPANLDYSKGMLSVSVISGGSKMEALNNWAKNNDAVVQIKADGIFIVMNYALTSRPLPAHIYSLNQSVSQFIDGLGTVYPGNHMQMGEFINKGSYSDVIFTVTFTKISPTLIALIAEQVKEMPFVIQKITGTFENGNLSGSITIQALGN